MNARYNQSNSDLGTFTYYQERENRSRTKGGKIYNAEEIREIDRKNKMLHENMVRIANKSIDWDNPMVELGEKRSSNLINNRLKKMNSIE